jgi:protease-4
MRRFLVGFLAVIGAISVVVVIGVIGLIVAAVNIAPGEPELPGTIVLNVDLNRDLPEGPGEDTLTRALVGPTTTLRDFLDALERGGDDPRVKGIFAQLGDDRLGLARIQEVRDALRVFRSKGKFAIAFADTFGELGPGTRPYYLATGFDEIWLQPLGAVGLTGLYSEVPFARDLLDRLGIGVSFERRREYKTVMNSLIEKAMPEPQRAALVDLLGSLDGQIVRGIAEARHLSEDQVRALVDRAPLLDEEAKAARLVDHLGDRESAIAEARAIAGENAKLVTVTRYLGGAGRPHQSGSTIALIYGTGLITRRGGDGILTGDRGIDATKLAAAFRAAERDEDVRAILFRIDSPGGSAVASETIWQQVHWTNANAKPVIVSMGNVAGSGGYYVAAPAAKIVAEPATLTGSIGVVAGKPYFSALLQKLGIEVEAVKRGAHAGMFSTMHDFSPDERQRLDAVIDRIYAGFKVHVADGRHLGSDAVEAVAKGRVWSGEEAKANGLVDALGGYAVALDLAREAAKIPAGAPVKLVVFPRRKGTIEELFDRLTGRDESTVHVVATPPSLSSLTEWLARLDAMMAAPGDLRMPPIGVR